MQTQSQAFAEAIYGLIVPLKNQRPDFQARYGGLCHSLPVMVLESGLTQTLGFLVTRGNGDPNGPEATLVRHIGTILGVEDDAVLRHVRQVELMDYIFLTQRFLKAMVWFKRYAQSILKVEGVDRPMTTVAIDTETGGGGTVMTPLLRPGVEAALRMADHPGLRFSRGLVTVPSDNAERGKAIGKHLNRVTSFRIPEFYCKAYERWRTLTEDTARFAVWFGKTEGRLYTGLGVAHVLETNTAIHRTYGVPYLPGSSLKGLARSYATNRLAADAIDVLFGAGGESGETPTDSSGYLLFHDAWWSPWDSGENPFVRDVVTVHHPDYYSSEGRTAATDFDSPNPNHQLTVQGTFLFAVEGHSSWANLGLELLKNALIEVGLGGKVTSGYGYFQHNRKAQNGHETKRSSTLDSVCSKIEKMDERSLASWLGANFRAVARKFEDDENQELRAFINDHHGDTIAAWENAEKGSKERKAYKRYHEKAN